MFVHSYEQGKGCSHGNEREKGGSHGNEQGKGGSHGNEHGWTGGEGGSKIAKFERTYLGARVHSMTDVRSGWVMFLVGFSRISKSHFCYSFALYLSCSNTGGNCMNFSKFDKFVTCMLLLRMSVKEKLPQMVLLCQQNSIVMLCKHSLCCITHILYANILASPSL